MQNKSYLCQTVAYSLFWGFTENFTSQIGLIVAFFKLNQNTLVNSMSIGMLSSILLAFLLGYMVDANKEFKKVLGGIYFIAGSIMLCLLVALYFDSWWT